ncbi:MAG: aminoacetone oxidase family FAD-binding enzyme [Bacteroidales bacterium]|nr:aminoacetone oxidase family FAD-binding enzyme [Bacteroidales bacterium]
MKSDILIIGGGASGLMAAFHAADAAVRSGEDIQVTVLEKMHRPGRKIMITGKGRCNFTNVKDWNAFSPHIRSRSNFVRSSFYNFPPAKTLDFFQSYGMKYVIERGDRAFPASYRASDVVDTLVNACHSRGVKIETDFEVASIAGTEPFSVVSVDGRKYTGRKLIIATGGLSYPSTGSSGDGYRWAEETGHSTSPLFPSLTALVPRGYKIRVNFGDLHIDRSVPMADLGKRLCGRQLKCVTATLFIDGNESDADTGELYFTDGGIEGPVGFQLSRKAVKALVNGSRVSLKVLVNPLSAEKDREEWNFDIDGYVGYERAVVTAGGVSDGNVVPKTMESRILPGLFFCGEVLDIDADTGGYNLQCAFSTGALAGLNAYKSL